MDYTSRNHSKYCLMCHLIFVCKYRKKLLSVFGTQVKKLLCDIAEENDIEIMKMEVDKDHIHILISYSSTKSILEIVRLFKQISTYRIWRQYDNDKYLRKHFWKEQTFWSDGYFACSIGQVSKDIIEKYIQT
ncbi:MAG: IS200/IS605 family transposase [Oscillospiraceae bacterium]|nr:IS200/IS605 family transposase [Oscillospiraceae bacterium]